MVMPALAFVVLAGLAPEPARGEPWRVASALDLPDWLRLSGEIRGRYESLDGQFRRDFQGSDQVLVFRSLMQMEIDAGPITFGAELQDSRAYFDDDGTPLSSSFVDPLDLLQAYVKFEAPGVLGPGSSTEVILGRQTVSIGSKRQVERVDYANVIRAFTGLHAISRNERGDELHAVYVALVGRFPTERDLLEDNVLQSDQEQWRRRVWAVHYRRADILPDLLSDVWGEVFIYGLDEDDTDAIATPNRNYATPGFRFFRAPKAGQWDLDIEGSLRFGNRRASSRPDDTERLETIASQILLRVGYTFDAPWRPRIAAQYYWTSGDDDPDDTRFDQYERLFGGRRTDLNNTSIHGPLTPANLSAPGLRFDVRAQAGWDARLHYSAPFLASETDSFVIARLRDPAGRSGRFLGHTLDARFRTWLWPGVARLEIGGSAFVFGRFTQSVPDGPQGGRTLFGYTQMTVYF